MSALLGSRRVLVAAAVVLVAGGTWLLGGLVNGPEGDWVEARQDDLVLGVEITGTLRAIDSGIIGPPQLPNVWNYKIAHMAPEGQEVEAGTVVLGFDTSELQQQLQEEMAEAASARKNIEKTRKQLNLERERDLLRMAEADANQRKARLKVDVPAELEKGSELALARLDLELAETERAYLEQRIASAQSSAKAQLAALENQLERAERRVQQIQESIEAMSVKAPRAGTVIYATNWRDEKKKVGDSCWRGESVIELPDLKAMQADAQVDEADAGRVAVEQSVTLRLDAHPDTEFGGRVSLIRRTVQRESWRTPQKVVRMEVDLDETDTLKMRPGMRFRGDVEIERVEEALLIPLEAVFTSDDGPIVYRKTLLGFEAVPVELGRRNETRVEVLDGLRAGDRVSRRDLDDDPGAAA